MASVCAIIDDTGIYCHQRQFMQTTIYADDKFVQHILSPATIYAGDNICRNKVIVSYQQGSDSMLVG